MGDERIQGNNYWAAVHVKCPFWKGETRRAIVCEGMVSGETIRRIMSGEDEKKRMMRKLCCKDYEQCKLFQLLYGGYK